MLGPFIDNFPAMWPLFQDGLVTTLIIAAGAIAVGMTVGAALSVARISDNRVLTAVAGAYIEIVRGTPALVQLFLIYFGLVNLGIRLETLHAAILGLGLNMAAYVAEILRAGILSVDRGQREAALALGMGPMKAMRLVIAPQAVRVVLPPLGNASISLIKDTSVAALIATPDLVLQARNLSSEYFLPLPIFLFVGLMYFCLCFPLSVFVRRLERRWDV
jgi:His/Glu/Gln/Arg/opine family amino acid ABC transporter permease subunit